ncbi:MAG: 2-octaprenyl-3-methyl-6-methoxy-1,4-benzoquinol hydroxylase [Rubrivivax sp.]|nr:MAG: 2-octaprenyl-3-methyl-6-methoxy-1,4-benzoquinol hydroxylase [Rubrivivax sp.]
MTSKKFDVCVSGSGAVAKCLALALSGQGWRVAWACAEPNRHPSAEDIRAYALNTRSLALLERLRIWPGLQASATPVHDMQIRGDGRGHLGFSAWQQCVSELAWIVDAAALERLLGEALKFSPHVTMVPALVDDALPADADLLAVCEGKQSATRAALGVEFVRSDYGHSALAARLTAAQPHQGVARQWFRSPDVLALLPFHAPSAGASYGLVWSMPQARAQQLLALPAPDFEAALQQALDEVDPGAWQALGPLTLGSPVASWPLAMAQAQQWSGPGWVLLGDAAHQVHPLAGQGLNLGLADVDTLVGILGEARESEPWRTAGDERLLRRYARRREWPTRAMSGVTDGLLHLFADDRAPLRELRNTGMALLDHMSPVKRWLVSRALDA